MSDKYVEDIYCATIIVAEQLSQRGVPSLG